MRLVAITSRHAFGDRVLRQFAEAGIRLDTLVITIQRNASRGRTEAGVIAWTRRSRARMLALWHGCRRWRGVARRITVAESPGDPKLHRLLVRARPDVLVLAGTGLVPAEVLSIPAVVTLNAHPGLLPWVRGVCPFENALLRGVPLGVTVHAVDAGIDTGPIITRVLLPIDESEKDRLLLTRRLEGAAIGALTEVVALLLRGEPLQLHTQASRYPYGRWVTDAERARAVELAARGEAFRLYRQWRAAAGGDVLPSDDRLLPASHGA